MLHLRPTEWAQDGRGFKASKWTPFSKLPLNCRITHILKYIKRYGVHPVHGGKLEVKDLIPLHFHKNAQGNFHCPVTFKVLGNNTAVCANLASGHVYCRDHPCSGEPVGSIEEEDECQEVKTSEETHEFSGGSEDEENKEDYRVFLAALKDEVKYDMGTNNHLDAIHGMEDVDQKETMGLYFRQPKRGIPSLQPGQIIEVLKGVFGLSTSPKLWWMKLSSDLVSMEVTYEGEKMKFQQNVFDPCVFMLENKGVTKALLLTHVDDIMLMADAPLLEHLQKIIGAKFPIDDWDNDEFEYVGCEYKCGRELIEINQALYSSNRVEKDEVVREITNPESKVSDKKDESLRPNAAVDRIFAEKERLAEKKAQEAADQAAANPEEAKAQEEAAKTAEEQKQKLKEAQAKRKTNERYTSNEDLYDQVRKKKQKGYDPRQRIAVRVVTSCGCLNLEIHCNIAPRTSDNFLRLCERNYYDNTIFHRLIRNFMLQGGDPTGTGRGGESGFEGGKPFKDEFDSRLLHQGPGVVSMANSGKNTNRTGVVRAVGSAKSSSTSHSRSQFFISLKSCEHLNNKHSVFGRVVGGLQILEVLNNWETDAKDKPVTEIKLIRTEVFKNPFKEITEEMAKPKVEKVVDPVATWFSNRRDPMQEHKNRNSTQVGKYLPDELPALPGQSKRPEAAWFCFGVRSSQPLPLPLTEETVELPSS
eukprot:g8560.t1